MSNQEPAPPSMPGRRSREIRIQPSTSTVIGVLLFTAGIWAMHRLLTVVLILVAALIIVGTVSPMLQWLESRHIRREIGIALVFFALLVGTVLFITLTIPSLLVQAAALLEQEPALRARMAKWLAGSSLTNPLAELLTSVRSGDLLKAAASDAIRFSTRVVATFAYILSAVFLALYIMIDRDRLRGSLFLLVPRSHHIRLSRVMMNLETIVGGYIRGQVITSAFMAAFVFILLRACNVPSALAIAMFAGIADVLPYIGALLSVGAVAAAVISRGPFTIILVLSLMIAYEEFESRVILPRVYGRALRLPSSVTLFALLSGSVLMGTAGALLALPVAAALLMLIEELRVDLPGQQEQAEDVKIRDRDNLGEAEYERRTEGLPVESAAAIAVEISANRHRIESAPAWSAPSTQEVETSLPAMPPEDEASDPVPARTDKRSHG